jgi:hypothetical protein
MIPKNRREILIFLGYEITNSKPEWSAFSGHESPQIRKIVTNSNRSRSSLAAEIGTRCPQMLFLQTFYRAWTPGCGVNKIKELVLSTTVALPEQSFRQSLRVTIKNSQTFHNRTRSVLPASELNS